MWYRGAMGKPQREASPHLWVPSTYFAEGFPYSVVNNVAEVFFQQMGASLGAVGLTSLLHLPWNLKLLWAPFVDQIATKKSWLVCMQSLGAVLLGLLAPVQSFPQVLTLAAGLFLLLAVTSATNDIAIDGYYMEVLDPGGQSRFVGYRAMAYKVSSLLVRGPLLALCGQLGWHFGFGVMAVVLAGAAGGHFLLLPEEARRGSSLRETLKRVGSRRKTILWGFLLLAAMVIVGRALSGPLSGVIQSVPGVQSISVSGWVAIGLLVVLTASGIFLPMQRRRLGRRRRSGYADALLSLLERPAIAVTLAFVILFRTGESFLQKMKFPFLNEELGLSVAQYAIANGTIGVIASFVATFLGGRLIARDGLQKWCWPFLIAQNTLNLLYAGLAWSAQGDLWWNAGEGNILLLSATIIAIEEFGAGLGTAVFMVYLMSLCHPDHKAAHFAILTALMSLSFTIAGSLSGFLAEAAGFPIYFLFTFLATVPMMLLAPKAIAIR